MPDAGMLMLGILGLAWLARGQGGNGQEPRSLGSLLNADISIITTDGGGPAVLLEEDTPIEVLPPAPGAPKVVTILGNDETTVVTTGINLWTESYFSTPGTLVEAVNQGYFEPPPAYQPRTWQQIEIESGLAGRQEAERQASTVVVVPEPALTGGAGTGWGVDIWGDEG
jgi:hypothetical protein